MPDEIQGDSVSYYSKASELKTSVEKALDTFRQSVDTQVDEWETTRDKWEVGGLKPPEGVPTKECLSALETALGNCLTGIEEWTEDVPVMLGSHDDTLLYCKPRIMHNGMSFGVELSIGTHSTAMLDPKALAADRSSSATIIKWIRPDPGAGDKWCIETKDYEGASNH